ncbi:glycosyltransferase [Agromyces sp. NPDC004153]
MTSVTLVTVDAGGNAPPMLDIARTLVRRGEDVRVLGHERQRDRVAATGATFEPLDALAFWDCTIPRSLPSTLGQFSRLGSDRPLRREVASRLRSDGTDVALVDCLTATAVLGARDAGVPNAVLFHTFLAYWRGAYARGPVGVASKLRGLDLRAAWQSADARIVTADAMLDPAARDGERGTTWVGPTDTGVPARPDPDRPPLVVVSLSTTWLPGQTSAYQRIVTALGPLPVRGLVTAGGIVPDRPIELPRNVEWAERRRHADVFPEAALVIGHGGHSTTSTALAHDLPLVILPMNPHADQPMVAHAIDRAGAGIALSPRARPEQVAEAVVRALGDQDMAVAAAGLGRRIRSGDAADAASDRLLALARRDARSPERSPEDA